MSPIAEVYVLRLVLLLHVLENSISPMLTNFILFQVSQVSDGRMILAMVFVVFFGVKHVSLRRRWIDP
jgi:hypothetical protein